MIAEANPARTDKALTCIRLSAVQWNILFWSRTDPQHINNVHARPQETHLCFQLGQENVVKYASHGDSLRCRYYGESFRGIDLDYFFFLNKLLIAKLIL